VEYSCFSSILLSCAPGACFFHPGAHFWNNKRLSPGILVFRRSRRSALAEVCVLRSSFTLVFLEVSSRPHLPIRARPHEQPVCFSFAGNIVRGRAREGRPPFSWMVRLNSEEFPSSDSVSRCRTIPFLASSRKQKLERVALFLHRLHCDGP